MLIKDEGIQILYLTSLSILALFSETHNLIISNIALDKMACIFRIMIYSLRPIPYHMQYSHLISKSKEAEYSCQPTIPFLVKISTNITASRTFLFSLCNYALALKTYSVASQRSNFCKLSN